MSALNSKIHSSRIPLHALEAQETAQQAKLLRNTDANSNIPQSLTDDYLTNYMNQLSLAENIFAPVDITHAEAMDCGKMLSELSPLSLNDNNSETTSEMGDNLLSQLLGVPSGNNIFNDIMPVNRLETAPSLQSNDIDVITDVINSLTNVISKYLPDNNNVAPVANNGVVDNEVVTAPAPAEDIYQVVVNNGIADLILNGKEITQDGIYAADTIEKKDDSLILHQEDYDIVFKTDDAVDVADSPTIVADTTIDVTDVADTTIDATDVADTTVDATKVADTTVDVTTVADTTIDATDVADTTVDATKVADTTIDVTKVANTTTDATKVANTTIDVTPVLTVDSTAKISAITNTTQDNTLINLDGEVIKIEPFINSVFA